jgi:hypothetical protein
VLLLQRDELGLVLLPGDRKLCPLPEDGTRGGAGTALQLCFDGPGESAASVFCEDSVRTDGIFVFRVQEETVHVEETCPNWGEAEAFVN